MNITDAKGEKCHQSSSCSLGEKFSAPFALKLGLMENFVKGIEKTGHEF